MANLDKFVELLKRSWDKTRKHFSLTLSISGDIITARSFFNLTSMTTHLHIEGLDITASEIELGKAIIRIFREIENQNQCLKNMKIEQGTTVSYRYLDISFDIVIAPVMPVMDPNDAKRAEIMQLVR